MTKVLVTGATGLIGSNIAAQLVARGDEVQALVRPGSEAGPLEEVGVHILRGDITNQDDVAASVKGAEVVVHSAAVLGGATQTADEHHAVNVRGTANLYDAAEAADVRRVVALSTTTFFDVRSAPLSEESPLDRSPSTDPYTVTKLAAYKDAMARVERGSDICIVISGGAYGPSPLPERSMVAPSFNGRICAAIQGQVADNVAFPIPWVYCEDVAAAAVAAIDRGRPGERYLAFGRVEDVGSIPFFCNRAAEIAGVDHRMTAISADRLDDPGMAERFGPSLIALAKRTFPEPWFVGERTRERLGYEPLSLDAGLRRTIPWLAQNGFIPARFAELP
jgi:nucleoside-diphosphate-sugar epimerase